MTTEETLEELEQWQEDLLRSMDKDINGILETPERYTRLVPEEGALKDLEGSIVMLLAYRYLYRFRDYHWLELITEAWPEDREMPTSKTFADLCDGDFKKWSDLVRKTVGVLREKYGKTDHEFVTEMVERIHTFNGDDDQGDELIDDLLEINGGDPLGSMMRNPHGQEQPRSPGAKVYNRIMEQVDVSKTDTGAAFWVLSSGNLMRDQLPEWAPYIQRLVEEVLKREREGTLGGGRTGRLLSGFLERPHYLWLIKNDPDHAGEWTEMARRHRVSLEKSN